jgi:hypothetical protein
MGPSAEIDSGTANNLQFPKCYGGHCDPSARIDFLLFELLESPTCTEEIIQFVRTVTWKLQAPCAVENTNHFHKKQNDALSAATKRSGTDTTSPPSTGKVAALASFRDLRTSAVCAHQYRIPVHLQWAESQRRESCRIIGFCPFPDMQKPGSPCPRCFIRQSPDLFKCRFPSFLFLPRVFHWLSDCMFERIALTQIFLVCSQRFVIGCRLAVD